MCHKEQRTLSHTLLTLRYHKVLFIIESADFSTG